MCVVGESHSLADLAYFQNKRFEYAPQLQQVVVDSSHSASHWVDNLWAVQSPNTLLSDSSSVNTQNSVLQTVFLNVLQTYS